MVCGLLEVWRERAGGRLHVDDVAGPDLADQPTGHLTTRHLAHADARRTSGGRADRVGAPFVAAPQRQRLPWGEREDVAEVVGDTKRDRGRVLGKRVDPGHGE